MPDINPPGASKTTAIESENILFEKIWDNTKPKNGKAII